MRLLDEQGHAERTVPFPHENGTVWVAAKAPEGLLTLDRVSGTIARLRDPTGTVRVNVQVPADRTIDIVGLSPDRKRLAIVWRGPGGFSVGVYDFSGRELARDARTPSRRASGRWSSAPTARDWLRPRTTVPPGCGMRRPAGR